MSNVPTSAGIGARHINSRWATSSTSTIGKQPSYGANIINFFSNWTSLWHSWTTHHKLYNWLIFSQQQNYGQLLLQRWWTRSLKWRSAVENMMMMMREMICWTWVVQKAESKSDWSKLNFLWSDWWKGWDFATLVHSISGVMYDWLDYVENALGCDQGT